jgi:hypothetical protein
MSKERMSGDATGWVRGARGIDGVGKPLAPHTSRRPPSRKAKTKVKRSGRKDWR